MNTAAKEEFASPGTKGWCDSQSRSRKETDDLRGQEGLSLSSKTQANTRMKSQPARQ